MWGQLGLTNIYCMNIINLLLYETMRIKNEASSLIDTDYMYLVPSFANHIQMRVKK